MLNTNNTVGMNTRSRTNETKKDGENNEENSNDIMDIARQNGNTQGVEVLTKENSLQGVRTNERTLDEQNDLTRTSQNGSNADNVNAIDTNAILNTLMMQNNILMILLKSQQNKPLK
jgi:hypothetical protein|uniref:Uncharacterized protein n=1 Tax=Sipha flava TaxID=143950 RepID=A0A2S2QAA6_9HEMI